MSLNYRIASSDQLVLKIDDQGFRRTLRYDIFDRGFLSMVKQWILKDGSPELVVSLSGGLNFVVSTKDLSDVGVMVRDHIERLLIDYLSELLGWEHIVLKVGAGPYDTRCSREIKVCDVYSGSLSAIKDYVHYRYFPPGTIFSAVRKWKKTTSLRCLEIISSDNGYKLEDIPFEEALDAIDWRSVIPLLRERVDRQRRLATY